MSAEMNGGELEIFRPLTGFNMTLLARYANNVNDVASGSNARFIGRPGMPPIDSLGENGNGDTA